jgi:hypothetical protein
MTNPLIDQMFMQGAILDATNDLSACSIVFGECHRFLFSWAVVWWARLVVTDSSSCYFLAG